MSGGVTVRNCGRWDGVGERGGGLDRIGAELANCKRVNVAPMAAERHLAGNQLGDLARRVVRLDGGPLVLYTE